MNNLVSIGRMAEMNGITVATLRLYDEMNLLKPRRTDPKTWATSAPRPPRRCW